MGVSTSEILMLLRARDEASRVLANLGGSLRGLDSSVAKSVSNTRQRGQALTTIGAGVAASGIKGLSALDEMTAAAMTYNEATAATQTQLDDVDLSFQDLHTMGLNLARDMPVAFEQVQPALYDIFSSIETDAPGAQTLLKGIGEAAIAGSVDMETAGRANLAILNAWKMDAEDVGRVNDVMFQLVRKGVGTYDEFGSSIGKAIPSAVRMGQSVEDVSGVMAFMTRNGLSAATASTSVARAMDALTKTKAQDNLREIGVEVTDATGKFRPFSDIMSDMRDKLGKLGPTARAAKLQEIFKGSGGTIQAMRVFNLGIEDSQGLLQTLTGDMQNAEGAASEAYDIMSQTPEAKLQQMTNQYEAMRAELGDKLLPVKLKLVEAISKVLDWFGNLSPAVKDIIAKGALLASVVAVIVGAIVAAVGIFMMLSAAMTVAGIGLGAVIGVVAGVVAGIAALIAIIWLVVKYWDQIKAVAIAVWEYIWNLLKEFGAWLSSTFTAIWGAVVDFAAGLWEKYGARVMDGVNQVWEAIQSFVDDVWGAISKFGELAQPFMTFVQNVVTVFSAVWSEAIQPYLAKSWEYIKSVFGNIMTVIGTVLRDVWSIVRNAFMNIWSIITTILSRVLDFIGNFVGFFIDFFRNIIDFFLNVFTGNWSGAWEALKNLASDGLDGLLGIIVSGFNMVVDTVGSILGGVGQLIADVFMAALNLVVATFTQIHDFIVNSLRMVAEGVLAWVDGIIAFFTTLWDVLVGHSIVPDMVNAIIEWFANLVSTVTSAVSGFVSGIINWFVNLGSRIVSAISKLVSSVINWFRNMASTVSSSVSGFVSKVVGFFSNLVSRVVAFVSNLVSKVVSGFIDLVNRAVAKAKELPGKVISGVTSLIGKMGSFVKDVHTKLVNGMTEMVNKAVAKAKELPGKVVSGLGDLGSRLYNSGSALIGGFVNGIRDKMGAAVDAAKNGLAAVRNYFPFSPAKKGPFSGKGYTTFSGQKLMKDFGVGITKGEASAIKAAEAATKRINSKMGEKLVAEAQKNYDKAKRIAISNNTKANKLRREQAASALAKAKKNAAAMLKADKARISNAEKIDKKYADTVKRIQTAQTAVGKVVNREWDNLTTTAKKSNTTLYKIIDSLNKAKTPKTNSLAKYVETQRKSLEKELNKLATVDTKLKDANKKLEDLIKARDSYVAKYQENASDLSDALGKKTAAGMIEAAKKQIAATKLYRENIEKLKKMGLSETLLQTIVDKGVDGGSEMASALVAGGADAVKEMNSLQGQLSKEATSLSKTAGDAMYSSGIASAQGIVKGLEKERKNILNKVQSIANAMSKELKKALKIKSPSRVTAEIGQFFGLGVAVGVEDSTPSVVREAAALAAAASDTISDNLFASTLSNMQTSAISKQIENSLDIDPDAADGVYNAGTQTVTLTLAPQTIQQLKLAVRDGVNESDGAATEVNQNITLSVPPEAMEDVETLLMWIRKLGYQIHLMGA